MTDESEKKSWYLMDDIPFTKDQKSILNDQSYRNISTNEMVHMRSDLPASVGITSINDIIYGPENDTELKTSALYFGVDKGVWHQTHRIVVEAVPEYITAERDYYDGIVALHDQIPLTHVYDTILDTDVQLAMQRLLCYRLTATMNYIKESGTGFVLIDNLPYLWREDFEGDPQRRLYMGMNQATSQYHSDRILPKDTDKVYAEKIKTVRMGFNKVVEQDIDAFSWLQQAPIMNEESYGNVISFRDLVMSVPIGSVRLTVYNEDDEVLGWLTYDQRYVVNPEAESFDNLDAVVLQCKFSHWKSHPDPYPVVNYVMEEYNVSSGFYPWVFTDDASPSLDLLDVLAGGAYDDEIIEDAQPSLDLLSAVITTFDNKDYDWVEDAKPSFDLLTASVTNYQNTVAYSEPTFNPSSYEKSGEFYRDEAQPSFDLISAIVNEFEFIEYTNYVPENAIASLDLVSVEITTYE